MTRSATELNLKLTACEQQANTQAERIAALEYQLTEVIGCVEEFMQMPTVSLKSRMHSAAVRAKTVVAR